MIANYHNNGLEPFLIALLTWFMVPFSRSAYEVKGFPELVRHCIEDYPAEQCIKPKKIRKCLRALDAIRYKGIPKEAYYSWIISDWIWYICNIVNVFMIFIDPVKAALFSMICCILRDVVAIVLDVIMGYKAFEAKFVIFNRYNLRYFMSGSSEKRPVKIGRCRVKNIKKTKRNDLVTVEMIGTEEIYNKVHFRGKIELRLESVYTLYEICNVYYIQ